MFFNSHLNSIANKRLFYDRMRKLKPLRLSDLFMQSPSSDVSGGCISPVCNLCKWWFSVITESLITEWPVCRHYYFIPQITLFCHDGLRCNLQGAASWVKGLVISLLGGPSATPSSHSRGGQLFVFTMS